jgi:hypothetical protein
MKPAVLSPRYLHFPAITTTASPLFSLGLCLLPDLCYLPHGVLEAHATLSSTYHYCTHKHRMATIQGTITNINSLLSGIV